ncbi:transporter substrate-binding domain-containing protein [Robbsia andropogonis]|uniref:transporter substrate-binding domain-containing protein n=1 Tax=Robbsia andropogonis TaxID=28092 RepID=UPI003D235E6A
MNRSFLSPVAPTFARAVTIGVMAVSACLASAAAHAEDSLTKMRNAGVIRIANTQSTPPWSMLGVNNRPEGYDVAVAQELAKRLKIAKVVFVADSFKNFVEGLKTGKYDLVMNDLTPTAEREKQIDFAAPYGVEQFRIFVRNESRIASRADLAGKSVGVTTGSSNEAWAKANLKDSTIKSYENGALVFSDLAIGRVDSVIISHFGGLKYANVNHLPVKEVGEPLTYQLSAPALAKGQPELKQAVTYAIQSMINDGTLANISKRWVGADYDMVSSIEIAKKEQ